MKSLNSFNNVDDLISELKNRQKTTEESKKLEEKDNRKNSIIMGILNYLDSNRPKKEESIRSDIGYEDNYDKYDKARSIILQLESSINGNGLISSDAFSRNIEYLFNLFGNEAEWIILVTRFKNLIKDEYVF